MSQGLENPFSNYQPPALDNVFSGRGKIDIVEFKMERLAGRVKQEMLEGQKIEEFIDGAYAHDVDYDCATLEPLITFSNPGVELDFVSTAVANGLCEAIQAKKISGANGAIGVAKRFSEERPRIATITAKFFRDSDAG